MSLWVFFLVFISVAMHATWNFLSKKSHPSAAFFCISSLFAALCWVWTVPVYGIPDTALCGRALIFWGSTLFFETLYFIGLFKAYSAADMSLAYPVARALPVLLVAGVSALLFKKIPNVWGIAGLVVVCCGCLLMPLKNFSEFSLKNYTGYAMRFILVAAIGTTGYTLVDSRLVALCASGAGQTEMTATYLLSFVINFGLFLTMGVLVLLNKKEQETIREFLRDPKELCYPAIAGLLSSLAYALVLAAMQKVEHLSYLQAFRQMSLPIGLLLGIIILKEPAHKPKLAGITLIVAGLVLIALLGK